MVDQCQYREMALAALMANSLVSMDVSVANELAQGAIDISLQDIGVDSLARLELSIFLGEQLQAEVSDSDMQEIATFAGLVDFLRSRDST